jgi:hydrogenase maturation factor
VQKVRKIGRLPFWLLVSSTVGILGFVSWITFLWFAADSNSTWKNIALAGWTTRSIAIAAVLLRTTVTTQAGIASSMLASILLEQHGIQLPKLAVVSAMRAAPPAPHTLVRHVWSGVNHKNILLTGLAVLLSGTTIFLQFTSTVLLADVDTGFVTECVFLAQVSCD